MRGACTEKLAVEDCRSFRICSALVCPGLVVMDLLILALIGEGLTPSEIQL